jgi:hypothetical protein
MADCFKLGNSNQRNDMASDTTDIALSAINSHESFKNIFIDDIRASCHYCNSNECLFNTVGNRSKKKAEKFGKQRSFVLQCDSRKIEVILENIKYVLEI